MGASDEITLLLTRLQKGDAHAANALIPYVYRELHHLAKGYLRRERPGHTLQPTALVNEAYIRLVQNPVDWRNRAHFFGVAAHIMRQILVGYARQHRAEKRGGARAKVELDENVVAEIDRQSEQVLELDEALDRLAANDPRLAKLVELRYFAGMSVEETANVLGISTKTVQRDWKVAKTLLRNAISNGLQ